MCLAQGHTTQWRRWGLNPWPLGLESSTLPLSHCARGPLEYLNLVRKQVESLYFPESKKQRRLSDCTNILSVWSSPLSACTYVQAGLQLCCSLQQSQVFSSRDPMDNSIWNWSDGLGTRCRCTWRVCFWIYFFLSLQQFLSISYRNLWHSQENRKHMIIGWTQITWAGCSGNDNRWGNSWAISWESLPYLFTPWYEHYQKISLLLTMSTLASAVIF